jgi:hypothetical protein
LKFGICSPRRNGAVIPATVPAECRFDARPASMECAP